MTPPLQRLAAFAGLLAALAVVTLLVAPISRDGLQDLIDPLGVAAPLAFVVLGAVLAAAFVPGPVLSAASGLLFGTWWGLLVSVSSSTLTCFIGVWLARRAGRPAVQELANPRVEAISRVLERHGVLGVILQRLLPAVPDAPFNYLYGLLGVAAWQVAVGNVIGSAPRAFSYTALGDAAGTGDGSMVVWSLVTMVVVSVVGLGLGAVAVRRARADREARRVEEEAAA